MPRCIALLLLLTAATAAEPVRPSGTLEMVYAMRYTAKELVFSVRSQGLTAKASFSVRVVRDAGPGSASVSLLRLVADDAKMLPEMVEVHYPLDEIGLDRTTAIHLLNAFVPALPGP